jgi:hypothetical protein
MFMWIATRRRRNSGSNRLALTYNLGFRAHELTRIEKLVSEHSHSFLEVWREYFRAQGG